MANLVARRCALVESAEDRELVWHLQYVSHQPGGLEELAKEVLDVHAGKVGTVSMLRFGTDARENYGAEEVKMIRGELPDEFAEDFLVSGELNPVDQFLDAISTVGRIDRQEIQLTKEQRATDRRSSSFPVSEFLSICARAAREQLADHLSELCLNPAVPLDGSWPWYFPDLVACVRERLASRLAARKAGPVTEIGRLIEDELEYAVASKCMVLIEGLPRIGKTFQAKAWCEANPGKARYVQVPSTNDEIGFFRAIAKAIGVSINLNSKAQELRQRIEEALQPGHLALVFDEAHYLWPNLIDQRSVPARINWLMTALVNHGVPVALVTTPQFLKTQTAVERKTRWTSAQFVGRVGIYKTLPDRLSEADLEKVARAMLPEGDDLSIKILIRYAQTSEKHLAAIESTVKRANYLAAREHRSEVKSSDISRAIRESVIPSDSAMVRALGTGTSGHRGNKRGGPVAEPVEPTLTSSPRETAPAGVMPPGSSAGAVILPSTRAEHDSLILEEAL
jgi:histone H3/H4